MKTKCGQCEFWGLNLRRDSDTAVKGRGIILGIERTNFIFFFNIEVVWSLFGSSSWPPVCF